MNDVSDIISKYDKEINKAISLYRVRARIYGVDMDDLRQDCRMVVWNCLKKRAESDPYFIPYIRASLRREIRTRLIERSEGCSQRTFDGGKKHFAELHKMFEQYLPEDYSTESTFSYVDSMEDEVMVSDFIKFCTRRSPDYGKIIVNKMKGLTVEEVAEAIGTYKKDVDRKTIKIKDLYREYFGVEINENDKTPSEKRVRNKRRHTH